MCRSIVPTRVSHARDRYPLRWVTRSGLRSPYSAPILPDTSASMIPSTNTLSASRRKSTSPSMPPLRNSSSRSILSLTTVVLLFSSFVFARLRMTRWSLFLQTLSLLHHFLGLYSRRTARGEKGRSSARVSIALASTSGRLRLRGSGRPTTSGHRTAHGENGHSSTRVNIGPSTLESCEDVKRLSYDVVEEQRMLKLRPSLMSLK